MHLLDFNIGDYHFILARLIRKDKKSSLIRQPLVAEQFLTIFTDVMIFMVSRNSDHLIIESPGLYIADHSMIEKLILEDELPDRLIFRLKKHLMYILNVDELYAYAFESLHTAIAEKDI